MYKNQSAIDALRRASGVYISDPSHPSARNSIVTMLEANNWNDDKIACDLLGEVLAFAADHADFELMHRILNHEHCSIGIVLDNAGVDYNALSGLLKNTNQSTARDTYQLMEQILNNAGMFLKEIALNKSIEENTNHMDNPGGGTLIHLAIHVISTRKLDPQHLELLLTHISSINSINVNKVNHTTGETPLIAAIRAQRHDIVMLLLRHRKIEPWQIIETHDRSGSESHGLTAIIVAQSIKYEYRNLAKNDHRLVTAEKIWSSVHSYLVNMRMNQLLSRDHDDSESIMSDISDNDNLQTELDEKLHDIDDDEMSTRAIASPADSNLYAEVSTRAVVTPANSNQSQSKNKRLREDKEDLATDSRKINLFAETLTVYPQTTDIIAEEKYDEHGSPCRDHTISLKGYY